MMPEMDGIALCRALKSDETLCDIPIILLTARAEEVDRIEGLRTGADAYVSKPFNIEVLQAQIQNLIESRRALHERYGKRILIEPTHRSITSDEETFYERARSVVEQHLAHHAFTVEFFAQEMSLSKSQFTRRLKDATGFTPAAFVLELRLQHAARLLAHHAGTISQIAYAVGYKDERHFTEIFRKHFGCTPSAYRARGRGQMTHLPRV